VSALYRSRRFRQAGAGAVPRSANDKARERFSVLDFGAKRDGATNDLGAFQAAVDAMALAGGGVVRAPGPGTYKLTGLLNMSDGVHLRVDDNATVDCTDSTAAYSVLAEGSTGAEVAIAANITSGDVIVKTTAPHGLAVGEWFLLKSQRACLHADAGAAWRLGETTEGAAQPFFAEPLQVLSVDSPTQVTTNSKVIFPGYRTDATAETYAGGRASATVAKINFAQRVKVTGGRWLKSAAGKSLVRMRWCMAPRVSIMDLQLGGSAGVGVYLESCFAGEVKAEATRPADWTLGGVDHAQFNSFKDVGSWYCDWRVKDVNGCQGWDQSYLGGEHPSIGPKLRMRSINAREDGATTHGACYGADIKVEAFGPQVSGFRNRARFSRISVRINGETTGGSAGLILSGWGALDTIVHDSLIAQCPLGIDYNPAGETDTAPPESQLRIHGVEFQQITNGPTIYLRDRAALDTAACAVSIKNVSMRDVQRGIYIGAGWHAGEVDGLHITRMATDAARYGVEVRPNAAGWNLRNIRGVDIGAGNSLVKVNAIADPAVKAAYSVAAWLDEPSIQLVGATGTRLSLPASPHVGYLSGSGLWTPTLTGTVNATPQAATECMWSVVGDTVTVAGQVRIVAPAAGQSRTNISLPTLPQNFSASIQAAGAGQTFGTAVPRSASIAADVTNEGLMFEWYATGAGEDKTFNFFAKYRALHA